MFIPIVEWNDLEEIDELITTNDSSCGCCNNTNQKGACICTDCKCHLRTRNRNTLWTDPVVLYSALSVAMMAILFLATK